MDLLCRCYSSLELKYAPRNGCVSEKPFIMDESTIEYVPALWSMGGGRMEGLLPSSAA